MFVKIIRKTIINDIALIKLERNFSSSANGSVIPIALPQINANLTGTGILVSEFLMFFVEFN